jgi:hypothetical protein
LDELSYGTYKRRLRDGLLAGLSGRDLENHVFATTKLESLDQFAMARIEHFCRTILWPITRRTRLRGPCPDQSRLF